MPGISPSLDSETRCFERFGNNLALFDTRITVDITCSVELLSSGPKGTVRHPSIVARKSFLGWSRAAGCGSLARVLALRFAVVRRIFVTPEAQPLRVPENDETVTEFIRTTHFQIRYSDHWVL